jgi:hypothetical protein
MMPITVGFIPWYAIKRTAPPKPTISAAAVCTIPKTEIRFSRSRVRPPTLTR